MNQVPRRQHEVFEPEQHRVLKPESRQSKPQHSLAQLRYAAWQMLAVHSLQLWPRVAAKEWRRPDLTDRLICPSGIAIATFAVDLH
jgi:hypothetical protein